MKMEIIDNLYNTVDTVELNDNHDVEDFLRNNKDKALLMEKKHISILINLMDNFYCIFDDENLKELLNNTGALYYDDYESGFTLEI